MERSGKINAAGGFLRAVGERRAGAQGAEDTPGLPVALVLAALDEAAPPGSEGVTIEALAVMLEVSRITLAQTLSNLSQLELVTLMQHDHSERVVLTDLGATVAAKQRARADDG